MQLFIKTITGRTITIETESQDSIENLKRRIYDLDGIPPNQLRLCYNGKQLQDNRTIANYNIPKESSLYVTQRLRGGAQIFVKTLTGKTITLDVESTDTIEMVKDQIFKREQVPIDLQRLIFCGKELENHYTVADYNILWKSGTIHLVMRLQTPIQLYINCLSLEKTIEIKAFMHSTVLYLKQKIQEAEGIPIEQQLIRFGGQILKDAKVTQDCEIASGSTLDLEIVNNVNKCTTM